jgi:hypothetical protein
MYNQIQSIIDRLVGKEGMQFYPWRLIFGMLILTIGMRIHSKTKPNTL